MERDVSARAEAIKEMSREKARIFRKTTDALSPLEEAALAWRKKKETEEGERQKETIGKGVSEELSFRETVAREVIDHDKRKLSEVPQKEDGGETGWVQYKPWQTEEDKKEKKQISINTATVVSLRKKIMAEEWARALGKPRQNDSFRDLEQEAAVWQEKKEAKERRKIEIRVRIERHKEVLSEVLVEFGESLKEKKDNTDPEALSDLLEGLLENAGEVFDIEWQKNGCLVWMEPWEEKRRRRISGFEAPVIYRARINKDLRISSFKEVEDEGVIEGLREELLTKPFRESLDEVSFSTDNEDEAKQFLEDKLSEMGRLISLERTKDGWFAAIESWEEMRSRNIKRKGKGPVMTDKIKISWKDGKLMII